MPDCHGPDDKSFMHEHERVVSRCWPGMPCQPRLAAENDGASAVRCVGLQRQGVQLAAHFSLKRLIDDLMLLDARFAAE